MATIQFLTILLTVTCFLDCVVSVTDKELEVRTVFYSKHLLKMLVIGIRLIRFQYI